jgi:hypothetical protein
MNDTSSNVLCQVNTQTIRESLGLLESFVVESKQFDEGKITKIYGDYCEMKSQILLNILKPGQSIQDMPFPYDVNLFQDYV